MSTIPDSLHLDMSSYTSIEREPIVSHITDWPKAMQESVCQIICRIAYDILSVIIFPIGLIRLAAWGIRVLIGRFVLQAVNISEEERRELNRAKEQLLMHPNVSPVKMTTPDNVELDGIYVRQNDDPDATTVVFCNPNMGFYELSANPEITFRDANGKRYNYFYYNYRGVGDSQGAPSPDGLLLDGYTAVKTLREKFGIPNKQIIVHGYSLGGAIGAFAASEFQGEDPNGNDSVSFCSDRSFSSLPLEVEAILSNVVGCCIPKILSILANWVGWSWNCMEWWRSINGYKWTVIALGDTIVPYNASVTKAWREENPEVYPERVIEMPGGHNCSFGQSEFELQQFHMHRAVELSFD